MSIGSTLDEIFNAITVIGRRPRTVAYFCLAVSLLSQTFLPVFCIVVDNGIVEDPQLECGPASINLKLNTRKPFEGHLYVKGLFSQPSCRIDGDSVSSNAAIAIPFQSCDLQRTRSLNPSGLYIRTEVVISFHPNFITKADRVYSVACFYMAADKIINTQVEVNMLVPGLQTQNVPMPTCRYQILSAGPDGHPISYATIGQAVYHKWTCDTDTSDMFCMKVVSCYVNNGQEEKFTLLDENGCAQDKHLLNNLEYITDLMAGQEAHVFKYADRAQLFFHCEVSVSIKEPKDSCPRPQCPEPPLLRGKRQQRLNVNASLQNEWWLNGIVYHPPDVDERNDVDVTNFVSSDSVCLEALELCMLIGTLALLILSAFVLFVFTVRQCFK